VDVHAAIHTVNKHARAPQLELTDGAFTSRPAAAPLSAIATQAVELFGQGDGFELRACLAPGCVLYFVKDHPRREWCSAGCGNRARAARHYARHGRT
jgi:predicted RNA-binding Zn ribbon-like protein